MFARYGVPGVLMSDNGPHFALAEFTSIAKKWGFEYVTSSPRYPQSNGKAENAVKTVKRLFTKCWESGQSEFLALMDWKTLTEGLGTSPAQRFSVADVRPSCPSLDHYCSLITQQRKIDRLYQQIKAASAVLLQSMCQAAEAHWSRRNGVIAFTWAEELQLGCLHGASWSLELWCQSGREHICSKSQATDTIRWTTTGESSRCWWSPTTTEQPKREGSTHPNTTQ